ncbi:unnamed protein product [Rangifer tarandus platyrhynchus]|uniref:Uncharacterized protein n=2 Tax=Rangifer tarandus platyrhynchus TaxID=3082113 RepID=A0ACB0EA25_RANTA|nr:unnamed protein product [Rangifer tarandus platyrhynchus]CAI9697478.1 unnamed protein product [Rangifer tarandus platyrhynchus]
MALRVVPRPGGGLGEESAGARRAIWAQLPPDALLPVRLPRADRMGTQDPRVGDSTSRTLESGAVAGGSTVLDISSPAPSSGSGPWFWEWPYPPHRSDMFHSLTILQ